MMIRAEKGGRGRSALECLSRAAACWELCTYIQTWPQSVSFGASTDVGGGIGCCRYYSQRQSYLMA